MRTSFSVEGGTSKSSCANARATPRERTTAETGKPHSRGIVKISYHSQCEKLK